MYDATTHAELPPTVMANLDTELHGHRAFLRYVVTDTAEFALQRSLRTIPGLAEVYDCGIPEPVLTADVVLGKTTPAPVRLGDIAIVTDTTRRDCNALEDGIRSRSAR